MGKKTIAFFSTNQIWGGSEILWTETVKELKRQNENIKVLIKYDAGKVQDFSNSPNILCISEKSTKLHLWQRLINKSGIAKFSPTDSLKTFLLHDKPALAIISQGNNIEGYEFMELCKSLHIPYVTITQLVVLSTWPVVNDERIEKFQALYNLAKMNFFVSAYTLKMHERFMGYPCSNAEIIYNPFVKNGNNSVSYPNITDEKYEVALLGRLENYHKGYDLLIDVIKSDKWKNRNIHFTIYGEGPHLQLIKRLAETNDVRKIQINDYVENIAEVWSRHHLLMMPSRLEGQSLTLIEAMNYKRAAIVTDVGGMRELIDDGFSGFIAEYPDVDSIDEALERAWHRRKDWEQMGENAYQSIRKKHPKDSVGYFIDELRKYL